MTFNVTFIVQIFNFLCAWCIVRYLFICPAIKLRNVVKGSLHALTAECETLERAIQETRDHEQRSWHMWYLHAQKIMKDRYQPICTREPVSVRIVTPEVPSGEIEKVTDQITLLVVKHVQDLL